MIEITNIHHGKQLCSIQTIKIILILLTYCMIFYEIFNIYYKNL